MKRVYYPYNKWEEVSFGMYKTINEDDNRQELISKAVALLTDPEELEKQMRTTTVFWPHSTERNMTCSSCNKQAWLGQAACCIYANVPEDLTKEAWSLLTDKQRKKANRVADKVIKEWSDNYAKDI